MSMRPGRPAPPASGAAAAQLNAAVAHHQAGRLSEAEAGYRRVLASMPKHFDAKHLLGVVAMQAGRLDEAHALISEALAINPKFAAAHNNLGNVYLRQGRHRDAQSCFQRAVELQPGFADAHFNLGNELRWQGRLQDAATHFRRATAADARSFHAHLNLGATMLDLGDPRGAVRAFETAVRLKPDRADALSNLGGALAGAGEPQRALEAIDRALAIDPESASALANRGTALARLGRHAEARKCLEQALARTPASAGARCNLANVLRESGAPAEALQHFEKALSLDPNLMEAHIGLAQSLRDLGRVDEAGDRARRLLRDHPGSAAALFFDATLRVERGDTRGAVEALRAAIALPGSGADAHYQLGIVLMRQLRSDEAIASYRQALAIDPAHAHARWALAMAQIPPVPATAADVARSRSNFARMLGELDRWFDRARTVTGHQSVGTAQPFYLAFQASNNRDLLARYGALCARLMAAGPAHPPASPKPGTATGRIRVGIASAHLCDHSVWNAIVKGWVGHLDRRRFELHLFNLGARDDAETELGRQWSHRLESGVRELPQWVAAIAGSDLDLLIYPEIGMDALTVRLASLRLAPVQAATWGHPETTGLPTIDHYLSAELLEPPDATAHYTEHLVRLPHLGVCYEPLAPTAADPDLASLGLPGGVPLLLCPGTPFKYSPLADPVWVEIARRAGRARLVFFRPSDSGVTDGLERRIERRFAEAGLTFADHVSFVPTLDRARYFGLMQRAHLLLDTLGFSGFNTVMQAIECGLPVVSLEGEFMRGRLGSGILRRMGMDALVANSDDAYVERVAALVRDDARLAEVRAEILARRGVLFGDLEPVRALERFCESVARPRAA